MAEYHIVIRDIDGANQPSVDIQFIVIKAQPIGVPMTPATVAFFVSKDGITSMMKKVDKEAMEGVTQ